LSAAWFFKFRHFKLLFAFLNINLFFPCLYFFVSYIYIFFGQGLLYNLCIIVEKCHIETITFNIGPLMNVLDQDLLNHQRIQTVRIDPDRTALIGTSDLIQGIMIALRHRQQSHLICH
jgi:hypothetical protein